ncbi:hypothetical protein CAMGR0001_2587 [Campylobacter gracilis RM3268]|uniref:Uncharacterized protein n=1 Tax=Campylobacter gracilis RM3268 TaxID=553220 RepID=C8PEU8_9BACT|nr:hypothetical protein CAMGR0001_2587 [Campylobacter gracilis RM3268]
MQKQCRAQPALTQPLEHVTGNCSRLWEPWRSFYRGGSDACPAHRAWGLRGPSAAFCKRSSRRSPAKQGGIFPLDAR